MRTQANITAQILLSLSAATCAAHSFHMLFPSIPLYSFVSPCTLLFAPSPLYHHTLSPSMSPPVLSPCTHLVEVSQWFLVCHKHFGKLSALVRVDPHHVAKKKDVIGCVANFLCIQDDLLELACLCKTLDYLRAEEDTLRSKVRGVDQTLLSHTFPGTPALRKTERARVGSTCFTSSPSSSEHSSC